MDINPKPVDGNSKSLDANSKSVDANPKSVDANPKTFDANSKSVDAKSTSVDAHILEKVTDEKPSNTNPKSVPNPVDTNPKSMDASPTSIDVNSKHDSDPTRDEQMSKDHNSKIPILVKKDKESSIVKIEAEKSENPCMGKSSIDISIPKISDSFAKDKIEFNEVLPSKELVKKDEMKEVWNVIGKSNQLNFEVKIESKEIDIKSPAKEMMNYSNTWMREATKDEEKISSEINTKMYG